MSETFVPVSVLRYDLKMAEEAYNRAQTYFNSLQVQKFKRALANFFKSERESFVVLDGGSKSNPDHVPPTNFRIIDGGKEAFSITRPKVRT